MTQPIPKHIAGHEVLSVQNSDNTVCYFDDVPTVILAATAPSQEALLSTDAPNMTAINQALRDANFPEGTRIGMTGPGITKAMVEQEQAKWNSIRKINGCIQFGGGHHDRDKMSE